MSKKFLVSLDLNKNELLNARLQNLSSDPSSPVAGQIYYNTADKVTKFYDGTQWVSGGSTKFGLFADRPSASKAGTLFVATDTYTLYMDNGTSWIKVSISPQDLTDAITNANLTINGTSNQIDASTVDGTVTISLPTDIYKHDIRIGHQEGFDIHFDQNSGDTFINQTTGDGAVYVNSYDFNVSYPASTDNIEYNALHVDTGASRTKVRNALNITGDNGYNTFDINGNTGYLSLNNSDTDNRILDIYSPDGYGARLQAQNELRLTSSNGNIQISPDGQTYINSQTIISGRLDALWSARVGQDLNVGGWNESDGTLLIRDYNNNNKFYVDSSTNSWGVPTVSLQDDTQLKFIDNYNEIVVGNIKLADVNNNPGRLEINASGELYLTTDGNQGSGNIILNPDSHVLVQGNLEVTNNIDARNGIHVGGSDFSNNGFIQVKDANNNNVVVMGGDSGEGYIEAHGYINLYTDYNTGGGQYAGIGFDNDANLVINASANNLILTSDSGDAYMNSVSSDNRIITVADLAAVSSGLMWKQAAHLLADFDVSLNGTSGTLTIDGHNPLGAIHDGYRILLKGQATDSQNGLYTYTDSGSGYSLVRSSDADTYAELKGAAIFIMEGDNYGTTSWVQTNHYLNDFTSQQWVQFSGQGSFTAGNGLELNGTEFTVKLDGDSLVKSSYGLHVNLAEGGALNNDGGLYVQVGTGLTINGSNEIVPDTNNGYGVRKYTTTIGNNSATSFNLDHNFNTRHVTVQVFESASPYAQVEVDVERTTSNRVTLRFASAPGTGEYEVVIVG